MKRALSTMVAVALLLGLGALAVLALPGAQVAVNPASVVMAAPLAAPEAPTVTLKWNNIAIPLQVSGVTTADGVASYINSNTNPPSAAGSITRVAKWESGSQGLYIRNVSDPFGDPDFDVATGDWLLVAANNTYTTTFTFAWVGNVPNQGYRSYSIVANGWSAIMLPLDTNTTTIQTADDLAGAIGNVTKVAEWQAGSQGLYIRNVGDPFGDPNFNVRIGYPYLVYSTSAKNWP